MASYFQHALTRDAVFFHRGDTFSTKIHSSLAASGWSGGQFAKWTDDGTGEPCAALADGRYCAILGNGSNEDADQLTALTGTNVRNRLVNLTFGGNVMATRTYEQYGYNARHGGPQVPLVYTCNQLLYISENGKITNENESDLTTFGPHNYPNGDAVVDMSHVAFGLCVVPPQTATLSMSSQYIVVQTNIGV